MLDNSNLRKAHKVKNDEFYTHISDIDNELKHYKDIFAGKTIYCNCDNPTKSNFVKWFYRLFNMLHLKRLIVTAYNKDGFGLYWDTDFSKVDINTIYINDCIENDVRYLSGNGDFRSEECIELLKQADVVVTNPPFSLFREYVKVLMDNNKEFLIIGNMNALKYKEVFPCIKNNKIGLGFTNGGKSFVIPNGEEKTVNICWYTTFPISKHNEELILFRKYTPESYPKYDNYDAINVDKLCDIPEDYDGVIGVPISFLDKYNPKQFEILGQTSGRFEFGIGPTLKYESPIGHNANGSICNGSKINTNACFLHTDKPVDRLYYTASNRTGYIQQLYTRILIRKIKQ